MTGEDVRRMIAEECESLRDLLIAKNRAYGNSALEPVRLFSRASAEEQILVRIDDKLSRLARGADAGEDVVQDLLGYLVLLRVARRAHGAQVQPEATKVAPFQTQTNAGSDAYHDRVCVTGEDEPSNRKLSHQRQLPRWVSDDVFVASIYTSGSLVANESGWSEYVWSDCLEEEGEEAIAMRSYVEPPRAASFGHVFEDEDEQSAYGNGAFAS